MGALDEVASYLDTASTRFTAGSNLFLNFLPHEPGTATAIYETEGLSPAYVYANDLPTYEQPRFQVVCRSSRSTTAQANAHAAWVILQRIANETLSSKTWLRVEAVQSPFILRRDEQNRPVYVCNFQGMRATTST